ncbi:hypothetical protein OPT61_g6490 [Boeremia exigua]|uniref:Uncharacterized protein n=1 Tax=Boeremia exigua TaxID=749465 RepID=A0ACC2I6F8_9PLEO|nr:hypothetical protein OPT61_g6490 [Boeremia exigua]
MESSSQDVKEMLVKPWMNQHASQLHPVFQLSDYASQRASAPINRQQQAGDITNRFCAIIQQYEKTLHGSDSAASIDICGTHSWEEVIQTARNAQKAYEAKAKTGAKGHLRRYLRHFCDYESTFTPWVGLLPSDQYFSVLCGSLKLVLGIAGKRSESRIMIFETFETLPKIIQKVQRNHDLYKDNNELGDIAIAIYIDILAMIDTMIVTLMNKSSWDRYKDAVKGPLADQDLKEKRRMFQASMAALDEQVEYLHRAESAKANAATSSMARSMEHTQQAVTSIQNGIATGFGDIQSTLNIHQQLRQQGWSGLEATLLDVLKGQKWDRDLNRVSQAANIRYIESEELQRRLQFHLADDAANAKQVLEFVCRSSQSHDTRDQGAMHWVLQAARFQNWVQSPHPDILLVNGNLECGMARYSSTSLLCGMLIQTLQAQEFVHVCQFFCGSHNSRSDPLAGPIGLMRSLIAQLLSLQEFEVGFLGRGKWTEGLRTNSLRVLCELFKRLFEQLPKNKIIFCIVDGISNFETSAWTEDLHLVVTTLLETVDEGHFGARLKVLITAASRSYSLSRLLSEDNKLSVPLGVGDRRFLTSRSISSELAQGRRSPVYLVADAHSYESVYDRDFDY